MHLTKIDLPLRMPGKTSRHRSLSYVLPWLLLFSTGTCSAFELETFQTHPGTRAMGMAGVFVAQADDSSAMWYNPAGVKSDAAAKADFSIEFANLPNVNADRAYARGGAELKFLGGYIDKKLALFGRVHPVTLGAGYFLPYRTTIDVDRPRPAADTSYIPYGDIDATHRQVSALIAAAPVSGLSWGATVDFMWSEIRCRDYDPCVNRTGPTGYGTNLGAKYTVAKFSSGEVSIAAAWRSRLVLRYASHNAEGLGQVVADYIPGRPHSFALGINLRTSTPLASININGQAERIGWSATTQDAAITNHQKLGIGIEALFPLHHDNNLALRLGSSRAASVENSSALRILAAGIGYGFERHHAVDFAWERRSSSSGSIENFSSLSYSIQR